ATEELIMQCDLVEPALRRALTNLPTHEVRQRLEHVLHTREDALYCSRNLRLLRAIEVLENIGTSEARKVLEVLAAGTPQFRITREARESLDRLARRSASRF